MGWPEVTLEASEFLGPHLTRFFWAGNLSSHPGLGAQWEHWPLWWTLPQQTLEEGDRSEKTSLSVSPKACLLDAGGVGEVGWGGHPYAALVTALDHA